MSVQASSYVWEHSTHKGTDLLLMLAIANIADTNGRAYPGIKRLSRDIRMDERTTQRALGRLAHSGELEIRPNEGPHGTNVYRIVMNLTMPLFGQGGGGELPPVRLPGDKGVAKGVTFDGGGGDTAMSPEPKEQLPNRKSGGQQAARTPAHADKSKKTNPAWFAYCEEMFGKYSVEPKRNARTNGLIANIIARCGEEEAPRLIRFVFQRKNEFYERLKYPLGIIVKDLDGLMIEMMQAEKRAKAPA